MGRCENCTKWEKDVYWSKFQLHFYTVLPKDSHLQLRFPKKFVKNLKEQLLESVVLKGPSGETWNLGLMRDGDDLFIQNGWEEFVNVHNLKEGDVLFFRYHGESRFDVFMFDQSNSCEKESLYFVKKCSTAEECNCNQEKNANKRTEREASLEIIPSRDTAAPFKKKPQRVEPDVEILQLPPSHGAKAISACKRNHVEPTPTLSIIPVLPKSEADSSEEEGNEELNPLYPLHYVSGRRKVTEAEKSRAYDLAVREGASCKMEHIVLAMKQTHVSSRFYLTIPFKVARSFFPPKKADVTLRFEGKTWPAKYYPYKRSSAIIGPGWADFVWENNLEIGDVCLFELCSTRKQDTILINVRIFRVVEEVVRLTKVVTGGKKRIQRML